MKTHSPPTWTDLDQVQPHLQAFLASRIKDQNDVDDLLQETLLRAARFRAANPEPDNLTAWIVRIAENVLTEHHRRRSRRPVREVELEFLDALEGPELPGAEEDGAPPWSAGPAPLEAQLLLECVGGALRELEPHDQEVLDRFYSGAGCCREVAQELELESAVVKSRLHRARARLAELVAQRLARLEPRPTAVRHGARTASGTTVCRPARRRPAKREGDCGVSRAAKE